MPRGTRVKSRASVPRAGPNSSSLDARGRQARKGKNACLLVSYRTLAPRRRLIYIYIETRKPKALELFHPDLHNARAATVQVLADA